MVYMYRKYLFICGVNSLGGNMNSLPLNISNPSNSPYTPYTPYTPNSPNSPNTLNKLNTSKVSGCPGGRMSWWIIKIEFKELRR